MHLSMNLEGSTQHNVSFLALTMAPDVSRNVHPSIFSCILAGLFVIKYIIFYEGLGVKVKKLKKISLEIVQIALKRP